MIIVLIGPSGSGKTTMAYKLRKELDGVIVSRDILRNQYASHQEYYNEDRTGIEKEINHTELVMIYDYLQKGKTVILDNTHLEMKYIERYKIFNVPIRFVVMETSLEQCIENQEKRERKVSSEIIKEQYEKFMKLTSKLETIETVKPISNLNYKPSIVIYDIDGTLALMGSRNPYDETTVEKDLTNLAVIDSIKNSNIIICSGRSETCRMQTERWLRANNIDYLHLLMRKEKDQRADWIVKEEMWRRIAQDYYISHMYDDRLQVVIRARQLGLNVFQVNWTNI